MMYLFVYSPSRSLLVYGGSILVREFIAELT